VWGPRKELQRWTQGANGKHMVNNDAGVGKRGGDDGEKRTASHGFNQERGDRTGQRTVEEMKPSSGHIGERGKVESQKRRRYRGT